MARVPYFNFYPSDFMTGVRGLSAQEVGVYTMLLCRMYEESGPVEMHALRLATYCGMREKTFSAVLEKLVELGKFEVVNGHLTNRRAMAEIQKRANDLKNNSKAGRASAQKRQENQGQASTGVEQPFNHTDTDIERKKEVSNETSKESTKARSENRGSRLPETWQPGPEERAYALGEGFTDQEVDRIAANFLDYWISKPGAAGRKANWTATWRTWIRKEADDGKRNAGGRNGGGAGHGPGRPVVSRTALYAEVAREIEAGSGLFGDRDGAAPRVKLISGGMG